MSQEREVSDEMLGAFVDGQLDGPEWASVARVIEGDASLREEVCRLRALKEMIRHSYAVPAARGGRRERAAGSRWFGLVAASLAFAVAGWFGHAEFSRPPALDAASAYALSGNWRSLRGDWASLPEGKVLVHVSSAGREALSAAVDEVEDLLRDARASNRRLQVEVVANGPGLDLLRADDAALAGRLAALRREYPELGFVACNQTIERRRAAGQPVELVAGTVVAPSALHEVVQRLRTGWIYVRA
jgi:intracellular sulfur oxidation DsrE/DsrF family protein